MAVLLASAGLFGIVSYTAAQRTAEFGTRMALGASAWDVIRLVSRQSLTWMTIGLVIGLGAAFALTRLLETLLFGISATDWATYTEIAALLAAVALLACYLPARRATQVDPMIALRCE